MLKVQYVSDLHLEFIDNRLFLKEFPLEPVGDILVIAGDTAYIDSKKYDIRKHSDFWKWCSDNYKETLLIPGNHEFYDNYDIAKLCDGMKWELEQNVNMYYNSVVRIGDIDFILSTLWGEIPKMYESYTEQAVSDFYRIRYNGYPLKGKDFTNLHYQCRDFIKNSILASDAAHKIVVTHHLPSMCVMSTEFIGSYINGAFTTEMCDFIEELQPDFWIYGHSHRNIEATIGKTKLVSNQLGYVGSREHSSFRQDKFIEM